MANIAVLGFGIVGSGVVEVISAGGVSEKAGEDIYVKKILDIRTFDDSPFKDRITGDFESILNDDSITIVVETMGGCNPAYDFSKRCLMAGKSVVTSNKELVATHGVELMRIAREKGVAYMFEASVGGGIPVIRPIVQCLAADEITEVMGILNGTTNYILAQMINNGTPFDVALKEAQKKGYAEKDPTADIEGYDTRRKIAILSSLCFGKAVDDAAIPTEGITKVTLEDIDAAAKKGCVIKLIGHSKRNPDGSIFAEVKPMEIPKDNPLSGIDGVFNGILIKGDVTGDVMFYGRGAGKKPTASAVIADVVDIIRNGNTNAPYWQ
ncbi:MAG: homoserine dehydrogenase [Eubacteriales bacterium]|nr:homoserine dehydrogenase [Eubacteriales bacterium]